MNNCKIFDGHNDVLFRLYLKNNSKSYLDFIGGDNEGHLDLPRMNQANFKGGLFAIYVSTPEQDISDSDKLVNYKDMVQDEYSLPLPRPVDVKDSLPVVLHQISILSKIERNSKNKVKICLSGKDLETSFKHDDQISVVMHIEGAECIDKNFYNLETLFRAGLRSIGPVWSRPTIFAEGVPFAFPTSPDIGEGLTEIGIELIKNCNALNMLIDTSHLNEKGFWDIAKYSNSPLVATHSNAHQICPHSRNLTNKQLDAIKETQGMVGVNSAPAFLRKDGKMVSDTDLQIIADHFKYLIEHLGEDKVGFGSDFDGAMMPKDLNSVLGMHKLVDLLIAQGFNQNLMMKISHLNWINLLKRVLN